MGAGGDAACPAAAVVGRGGSSLPPSMNPVQHGRCFSEPGVSAKSVLKSAGGASANGLTGLICLPVDHVPLPQRVAAAACSS